MATATTPARRRDHMSVLSRRVDMGDIVRVKEVWLVKGQHWQVRFTLGAPLDVLPSERPLPGTAQHHPHHPHRRIDVSMDLQADKQVALGVAFTDELGHDVPAPEGTVVSWSNDNDEVIALTTNEDGSANAAATGVLGSSIVSVDVTFPNGRTASGDLLLTVVPGDAERVTIAAGEVTEVTPDEPTIPEEPTEPPAPPEEPVP